MKELEVINKIIHGLLANNINLSITSLKPFRIGIPKAQIIVKSTGAATIKTREPGALLRLKMGSIGKTREIWTGETVKEYSYAKADNIVSDILRL